MPFRFCEKQQDSRYNAKDLWKLMTHFYVNLELHILLYQCPTLLLSVFTHNKIVNAENEINLLQKSQVNPLSIQSLQKSPVHPLPPLPENHELMRITQTDRKYSPMVLVLGWTDAKHQYLQSTCEKYQDLGCSTAALTLPAEYALNHTEVLRFLEFHAYCRTSTIYNASLVLN